MLNHLSRLKSYQSELWRKRLMLQKQINGTCLIAGKSIINFSSNDYLDLATHPLVKKAFIKGVKQYGVGSGSSALISGYYKAHRMFEEKFAEFVNRPRAILFNSGYMANLAVMSTLLNRHSSVLADKYCHASILEGIRLSGAKLHRFKHNNCLHAKFCLQKVKSALLVSESVFSMQGSISPIPQLVELAQQHQSILAIDDAHGFGVIGKNGQGVCEFFNLTPSDIHFLITPLGKALGGLGGMVSGDENNIESLIQFAKTYRYTTAIPPALAVAALAALKVLQAETWRREQLLSRIHFFIAQTKKYSLEVDSNDLTPIKSIIIGDNKIALKIAYGLQKNGFLVACIRPPTVPKGTARLRISLNCSHTENDILNLLNLISDAYAKHRPI